MNNAKSLYSLSLDQCVAAILAGGADRTVLMQGHMGTGKSSTLNMLSEQLPDHIPCYFDTTTKDLGDISIRDLARLDDGKRYVTYLTNEELGVHHDKPIILMIDEFGKANPAVKNALLRIMLERKIGSYTLHPDSIVFATTNLGAEGVGDLLPPHARNRLTVVNVRKPDNMEFIEWGIANGIDHGVLSWCKDNPHAFDSFENVANPDDNQYIFHPQAQRAAFCTPRSLHAASDWVKQADKFDAQTLTSLLMGTVGEKAGLDLSAHLRLLHDLPSLDSIKSDPKNAKLPDSAAAKVMVVYRSLATIDKSWVDAWMDYLVRLPAEEQGYFVNGAVKNTKYPKDRLDALTSNKKFRDWAIANNYMFAADKK